MLVRSLPRDSALIQAAAGDAVRWSTTDHLIASLIDAVRWQTHAAQQAQSRRRLRRPDPIRRPGDPKPTTLGAGKGMTPAELTAQLARPRREKKEMSTHV